MALLGGTLDSVSHLVRLFWRAKSGDAAPALQFAAPGLHLPTLHCTRVPRPPSRCGLARLPAAHPCLSGQSDARPHHGRKSLGIDYFTHCRLPFSFPSLLLRAIINPSPLIETTKSPYNSSQQIILTFGTFVVSRCLRPSLSCKRPLRATSCGPQSSSSPSPSTNYHNDDQVSTAGFHALEP